MLGSIPRCSTPSATSGFSPRSAAGGQSVVQLAEALGVSESTIRRDLDILAKGGQLERLYGGAMLTQGSRANITDSGGVEDPFVSETRADFELRRRMAAEASSLIGDGDVVVLDIGSTTPLVARELRGRPVTIITSNLAVLDEVRGDDAVELVLLGGVCGAINSRSSACWPSKSSAT